MQKVPLAIVPPRMSHSNQEKGPGHGMVKNPVYFCQIFLNNLAIEPPILWVGSYESS